ncbi:TonB-dependent receptor [Temperatibacter marinus]|uniref:TonB-dependent receptor n=1 Tax=Temperatibacter marinus TaxID=1456591 RepID=A0AA52HB56_9PROT|nr:TonB-dependent receptor [Temperatibacter marinus]WND03293.1 TonB-dependent receptor [Temperatibacter marinus]
MRSMKKALLSSAAIMLVAGSNPAVFAQDQEQEVVDVITVTATKRPQTLQEVPVAVSVVGAEEIEKMSVNDLIDLQSMVPSFRMSQLQKSSQVNFIVRGFGNGANNPGIESAVGVFIDGVYRSRSAAAILDLPVLERVEILRGPQSTLFGKNVSAGAISIVTKGPEDEFGGSVEASYGNFNALNIKGTVTGPLSDTMAYRVSASMGKRDGFYTNTFLDTDVNERDRFSLRGQLKFEPTDSTTFRLIADYNKIDEECCGTIQLFNGPATQFIGAPAPFGLGSAIARDDDPAARETVMSQQPTNELIGKGISLQADVNMDWASFTSITSYRTQTDDNNSEVDFSAADIAIVPTENTYKTFSQEFRLASTGAGNTVDWMVNAYFSDESVDTERGVLFGADTYNYLNGVSGGGLDLLQYTILGLPQGTFHQPGSGLNDAWVMDNTTYSLNAQLDFNVTDRLTLSAGVAYMNDKKEATSNVTTNEVFGNLNLYDIGNQVLFQTAFATTYAGFGVDATDPAQIAGLEAVAPGTLAAVTAGSQAFADANEADPAVNPLLGLQALQFLPNPFYNISPSDYGTLKGDKWVYSLKMAYDVSDNVNAYVSYSTGWKAGGFNLSSDSSPTREEATTRLGLSGTSLERAKLGTRYADPEDVSVFEIGVKASLDRGNIYMALFDQKIENFQSNLFIGNAFALTNAGAQSSKGFEIEGNYSVTDNLLLGYGLTYIDAVYDEFVGAPCDTGVCDLSGTRPAGIAEWNITSSATYNFELRNGLSGFVRAEYNYESDVQVVDNIASTLATREVSLVNMSAGIETENGFQISAWVRNLTGDDFFVSAFPTTIQTGSFSAYMNAPRTYGLTVRKNF